MRWLTWSASLLGLGLLLIVAAAPAQAQATRTWVSGVGDDANPCSRTAPCKTFAGAISKTAAGGEINCIDPGGFGALTITKAITIDCANTEAGVLVSGTNGFNVSAGVNDVVVLRGLDLFGTVTTPALNGIVFNTGAALIVENSKITEFNAAGATSGFGILFQPTGTAKLYVHNTSIVNNGTGATGGGILVRPTGSGNAKAVIDHVKASQNINGIIADGTATTGTVNVTIRDSTFAGSAANGVSLVTPAAGGAVTLVAVVKSTISNNTTGVSSAGVKSAVSLFDSAITGNGTGMSATASGAIFSFKNNNVDTNGSDGAATGTIVAQ